MKKKLLFVLTFVFLFALCLTAIVTSRDDIFWEVPSALSAVDSRFPKAVSDSSNSYIFFEEVDVRTNRIWISMLCRKEKSFSWNKPVRISEKAISYSGEVPDIFSVAVSKKGKIALSVLVSDEKTDDYAIGIYLSEDKGKTFTYSQLSRRTKTVVGPRIFGTSGGGFVVFTSLGESTGEALGEKGFFSLLYSVSEDGKNWGELFSFRPSEKITNPFVPYLIPVKGGDMVVFQGKNKVNDFFQIYSAVSTNGLRSWTDPHLVTDNSSFPIGTFEDYAKFTNQRPVLFADGKKLHIAWERSVAASENSRIMVADIALDGTLSEVEELTKTSGINARRPQFYRYGDDLSLVWFDNRTGIYGIYSATKGAVGWKEQTLVSDNRNAQFAYPLFFDRGNELAFVWQRDVSSTESRIYVYEWDHSAKPPKIAAKSFVENKRSTAQKVSAKVVFPQDTNGIAGFTYIWTQDTQEEPPCDIQDLKKASDVNISALADEDGRYYFKARVMDNAGNWSDSATLEYYRDLTPPKPPLIQEIVKDRLGFASTNDLSVFWQPDPSDDDVAGYSWTLKPIASLEKNLVVNNTHRITLSDSAVKKKLLSRTERYASYLDKPPKPPRRMLGEAAKTSYTNYENGYYVFSVCAIDTVGNIGEPSACLVYLNKYRPSTKIFTVKQQTDEMGVLAIDINGEGFTYDGIISEIVFSEIDTGTDIHFYNSKKDFKILSDERISDFRIPDLRAGRYKITLNHTDRGLKKWNGILAVAPSGTVKYEPQFMFEQQWHVSPPPAARFVFNLDKLPLYALLCLSLCGIAAVIRGLYSTARDSVQIKNEVTALLTGDFMPYEKKEKLLALKRKGISLKLKLMFFTTVLVLMIVSLVSVSLGQSMTATQERILAKGLQDRVNVIMESMASGVRNYLPDGEEKLVEIGVIPNQTDYFAEASYATVLGLPADGKNANIDYVWASNDRDIISKIDTEILRQGVSRYQGLPPEFVTTNEALNAEAVEQTRTVAERINALSAEMGALNLRTDSERISDINTQIQGFTEEINKILDNLSKEGSGSYPSFNADILDREQTDYLFYKPVLYRQGSDSEHFVHGVVIMQVSTVALIETVAQAQRNVVRIALITAIVAIVIGIVGSLLVASIFVNPIKRLVMHVNKIGEVVDKEELEGTEIFIRSHDEIRTLGDAVNDMTRGLVKAAKDEKVAAKIREENVKAREAAAKAQAQAAEEAELAAKAREEAAEARAEAMEKEKMELDGKAVQQAFIPLVQSRVGKETTADLHDTAVELFGYYEGADAVSGDYFDYKKLDERWYAIIKCDISGHGVPAALIMTVVATLFRKYFETWSFKSNGTKIDLLVTQINDFIESLGLKGKFATLMICLFDTKTGDVYMCNAGDNIVHYYDSVEKVEKVVTLHEAPAAGPLPSFMVEMKGGYKVEKLRLKKNDVLFLYTDGIEEATRFFRNGNFEVTACAEPGLKAGEIHETHKVGQESEQMEPTRVKDILESVFNKRMYRLVKYHSPIPDEVLEFDFTKCEGTLNESILALAAVEKVFRMYKKPGAQGEVFKNEAGDVLINGDGIKVDRKIDAFLKKTFNRYDFYCGNQVDLGEPNYLYYTGLNEDAQADDLTLLAIKKL